ncbi:MAG: 30S ribosomal protein S13 [Candidatus Omnitrophota bacterium]|jgi:small subunit ribosomal protein S13
MPRILGVDIPKEKKVKIALTYLYGIGHALSAVILRESGVNGDKRAKDLSDEEIAHITNAFEKLGLRLEGDLRRDISQDIKRLMDIGSYRGTRHKKGLPARGQRTRTNARSRKGPRKGNQAMVKKIEAKKSAPKPAK